MIGAAIVITLGLCTYMYYILQDRDDAPVSKEELGFVALSSCIAMFIGGSIIYGLMYMRITTIYPPVDGVDMGDAPF